ncbi:MAG: T9SS type A sorting domain-containing protein [Bacteroidia bacterium]|nr:T9SS type A sorting domain-containing protein [Bacteroidia bacterium]
MIKKSLLLLTLIFIITKANATWIPLGAGLPGKVRTVAVFNGDIYAGGDFTTPGRVAKWNGVSWEAVGNGFNGAVNVLTVHNNQLYAGGAFTTSGSTSTKYIAVLSGGAWQEVGGGLNNPVNALLSDAAGLYVGGTFVVGGTTTVGRIALFNGTTWSQVGTVPSAGYVNTVAKFNGVIYIGGTFTGYAAKLVGGAWTALTGGLNSEVLTMSVFANKLYIGGRFNSPGQYYGSYSGTGSVGTAIYSLNPNGHLHALLGTPLKIFGGGAFTSSPSAGINLPHFFSTTYVGPNNLSAEGSAFNDNVNAIAYLNGKVIVGGDFTQSGATPLSRIAISNETIDVQEISGQVVNKSFYPNPVTTSATLKIETLELVQNPSLIIVDSQYRLVEQKTDMTRNGKEIEFRISFNSLAAGTYFYTVIDDAGNNLLVDRFIAE